MIGALAGGIVLLLALLLVLVVLLGWRAKAKLAVAYPPPGRMVDMGGYRLHIRCQGAAAAGNPTVVMEGGNGEPCLTWASVQPEVATFAQVCTYDRAGLGWSESSPNPRTAANIVAELHTLLAQADIEPPYVLVGHSIGGMFVRLYAHQHPEQIAGMVLVDAAHEEQELRFPEAIQKSGRQSRRMMSWIMRLLGGLSSSGLLALLAANGHLSWPTPVPQSARAEYVGIACTGPKCFRTIAEESLAVEDSFAAVRAAGIKTLGNIPLLVLSAGVFPIAGGRGLPAQDIERLRVLLKEFPAELAALSPQGKQVLAEKSGHYIQVDQPELVVDAIRQVVAACRTS
jgi:pimeloyl-ACP methyl ester carboxylesterase